MGFTFCGRSLKRIDNLLKSLSFLVLSEESISEKGPKNKCDSDLNSPVHTVP